MLKSAVFTILFIFDKPLDKVYNIHIVLINQSNALGVASVAQSRSLQPILFLCLVSLSRGFLGSFTPLPVSFSFDATTASLSSNFSFNK